MKRKIAVSLCTLLTSTALLCGCGSTSGQDTASSAESAQSVSTEESTSGSDSEANQTTDSTTISEADTADSGKLPATCPLEDGVYTADADTDSSMFHINEACDDTCTLIVQDGAMTAHLILGGTGIINLYQGSKEEAQEDGAELLQPVTETVTYSDGMKEDVYAFDVPVPVLDEEFPVAIVGEHGNWYDHTVMISNPVPAE